MQQTDTGHTHNAPECASSLVGVVCFDGSVRLAGLAARWAPDDGQISASAAALMRDERGALYSANGDTRYRGLTYEGWIDIVWHFAPRWDLASRIERRVARHNLTGPGASIVAADAGLIGNRPATRIAAALGFEPAPGWRLNAEIGVDRASGSDNRYVVLRTVWSVPSLLAGRW